MTYKSIIALAIWIGILFSCKQSPDSNAKADKKKDVACEKVIGVENHLSSHFCDTCFTPAQARVFEAISGSVELELKEIDFKRLYEHYEYTLSFRGKKDSLDWIERHPDVYRYLLFIRKRESGAYWYETSLYRVTWYGTEKRLNSMIDLVAQKYFVQDRYFFKLFPQINDGRDSGFSNEDWHKQFDYLECYGREHYPNGKEYQVTSPPNYGHIIPQNIYAYTKVHTWGTTYQHRFTLSAPAHYFYFNDSIRKQFEYPVTEKDIAIYIDKSQIDNIKNLIVY